MKNKLIVIILLCLLAFSCSFGPRSLRNTNETNDISKVNTTQEITEKNAKKILSQYTINFELPNPLYGEYGTRQARFDPSHESSIYCSAVLLDDFSTKAHIMVQCKADSLDETACAEFRKKYIEENIREGSFRIQIEMESGFSPKSLDPDHWSIYIENAREIMIEPDEITNSSVTATNDSIFSNYYNMSFSRSLLRNNITLYFKNRTFFGEDLLGGDNPFIVLVFSREKKTMSRVAWKTMKTEKND